MNNKKCDKKCQKSERAQKVDAMIEKILNDENTRTKTDPLGSYTGVADRPYENVVQDADDL